MEQPVETGVKVQSGFGVQTAERTAELAAIAVAAASKAEVEAAYVMALRRPRNEEDVRVRIKRLCQNPGFAKKAKYSKPVGNERITGPSIRFAEAILQLWGNNLTQKTAIFDNDELRIVKVTVRDLEYNVAYSEEFTVRKTVERKSNKGREVLGRRLNTIGEQVFIVKATDDELQNKESALSSKIIRNQGLRLIPEHIKDEALQVVDQTLAKRIKDNPDAERNELVDEFGTVGVMPSDLESYLGHPLAQTTEKELLILREIITAIKDEHTTWIEIVEAKKRTVGEPALAEPEAPTTGNAQDALKAHLDSLKPEAQKFAAPSPMSEEEFDRRVNVLRPPLQRTEAGQKLLADVHAGIKVPIGQTIPANLRVLYLRGLERATELMKSNTRKEGSK